MLHSNLSYRRGVAMSKRLTRSLLALAIAASLLFVGAWAGEQNASNEFTATMKGSSEKPKGPSSASGTFTVQFKNGQACYKMSVKGLGAKPVAAHIHRGASGVNGPIVIDLKPTFKGTSPRISQKCVSAKASIVSAVRRNPGSFYANVHTSKNPGGAARGQLKRDTSGNDG